MYSRTFSSQITDLSPFIRAMRQRVDFNSSSGGFPTEKRCQIAGSNFQPQPSPSPSGSGFFPRLARAM